MPTLLAADMLDDDTLDTRTDKELADATNERLLMAVMTDDVRDLGRAMEEGWGAWLGSTWAHNENERTNPVLMAIVHPGKQPCLDAFQSWTHDVHRWTFGRWAPVHWAVASHNEDALAWALRLGASLLDQENPHRTSSVRRSALALAAQMGDPHWLRRIVDIAVHEDKFRSHDEDAWRKPLTVTSLIKGDRGATIPALGLALHELAEQDRRRFLGQPHEGGDVEGCVRALADLGFCPDSSKTPAAKLTCALALHEPQAPGLEAYQRATLLALALGSGRPPYGPWPLEVPLEPVKVFDQAGERLDPSWREALLLIGLTEGPDHGHWGMAASRELRRQFNERSNFESWAPGQVERASEAMEQSFDQAQIPMFQRPFYGHELAFLQFLGLGENQRSQSQKGDLWQVWQERLALLEVTASVQAEGHEPSGRARQRL